MVEYSSYYKSPTDTVNFHQLDLSKVQNGILRGQLSYANLEELLIVHTDKLDNITTVKRPVKAGDKVKADLIYMRDATTATPLSDRISTKHIAHLADNTLLRALNTLRGIDHALAFYDNNEVYKGFRETLKNILINFIREVDSIMASQATNMAEALNASHETFNTCLIQILHQSGLDQGASTSHDPNKFYRDLLVHYRYLAAVLEPAAAVKTTSKADNKSVVQIIDPITTKTHEQKTGLKAVSDIGSKKTYQGVQSVAIQLANKAFKDQLSADNTQLGGQSRFRLPHTVKHAFVERLEVDGIEKNFTVRCSSTAGVANGMSLEERQDATNYNLKQVWQFIKTNYAEYKKKGLQHVVLLARTARRKTGGKVNQVEINDLMQNSIDEMNNNNNIDSHNFGFSRMPVSFYALATKPFNPVVISNNFFANQADNDSKKPVSGLQTTGSRTHEIADFMQESSNAGRLMMYGCASNANRAGAISITMTANAVAAQSEQLSFKDASDHLVKTGHETFVGALTCPGSRGLKSESEQYGLFSSIANKFLYGGSSSSRNKTPVKGLRAVRIAYNNKPDYVLHLDSSEDKTKIIPVSTNRNKLTNEEAEKVLNLSLTGLPIDVYRVEKDKFEHPTLVIDGKQRAIQPKVLGTGKGLSYKCSTVLPVSESTVCKVLPLCRGGLSPEPEKALINEITMLKKVGELKGRVIIQYHHLNNDMTVFQAYIPITRGGEPLDTFLKKPSWKEGQNHETTLNICGSLAKALAKIHKQKIVHGDLHSENVLVNLKDDNTYDVKIIDFGLSRHVGAIRKSFNRASDHHLPAEIDQPGQYSCNEDIYSLGLLLKEVLFKNETKFCDQIPSEMHDSLTTLLNLMQAEYSEFAPARPTAQQVADVFSAISQNENVTAMIEKLASHLNTQNTNLCIEEIAIKLNKLNKLKKEIDKAYNKFETIKPPVCDEKLLSLFDKDRKELSNKSISELNGMLQKLNNEIKYCRYVKKSDEAISSLEQYVDNPTSIANTTVFNRLRLKRNHLIQMRRNQADGNKMPNNNGTFSRYRNESFKYTVQQLSFSASLSSRSRLSLIDRVVTVINQALTTMGIKSQLRTASLDYNFFEKNTQRNTNKAINDVKNLIARPPSIACR